MTFEERRSLRADIAQLCKKPHTATRVAKMVSASAYVADDESGEMTISIDEADSRTLWEWRASVDRWLPPKKAPILRLRTVVSRPTVRVEDASAQSQAQPHDTGIQSQAQPEDEGGQSLAQAPAETSDYDSVSTVGVHHRGGIVLHRRSEAVESDCFDDFSDSSLSDSDCD